MGKVIIYYPGGYRTTPSVVGRHPTIIGTSIVGYVRSFNVSLQLFYNNLKPDSSILRVCSHQAHGKTLVLKKGSLCQDSDSTVYLGASQTNNNSGFSKKNRKNNVGHIKLA
jgi:hypothetical protein